MPRPPTHPVRMIWRALAIPESAARNLFNYPGPIEEMSAMRVEWVFDWARESTALNPLWLAQLRDEYFFRL